MQCITTTCSRQVPEPFRIDGARDALNVSANGNLTQSVGPVMRQVLRFVTTHESRLTRCVPSQSFETRGFAFQLLCATMVHGYVVFTGLTFHDFSLLVNGFTSKIFLFFIGALGGQVHHLAWRVRRLPAIRTHVRLQWCATAATIFAFIDQRCVGHRSDSIMASSFALSACS